MMNMLCVNLFFALFLNTAHAQIDLHAHLHMEPGMNGFLQGSFHEPPRADHWKDKIFTRATAQSLAEMNEETRPKLIVLSLYAHPYFGYSFKKDGFHFDRKENVRRRIEQEYQEFVKFVSEHSDRFAIAKNASEARAILKSKRTVIVLSLEGAWATLDSPEDYQRWIEERGLAIVTPVHLTPDSLGGNALMTIIVSLFNSTFDFIKSAWSTRGECLKTFCKSVEGFTSEGNAVVDELMKRKVWIDLAHANDIEVESLIKKHEAQKLPILITHTQLREFYPVERGLGNQEINYIRKNDGIIGLLPSQYMMPAALKKAELEQTDKNKQNKAACISGLDVFKTTVDYAIATLGAPERVTLSSDVNAPLDGLSPACGEHPEQNELLQKGFYTYSQWNAVTKYVSPEKAWADRSLEHFLTLWDKVRPSVMKAKSRTP